MGRTMLSNVNSGGLGQSIGPGGVNAHSSMNLQNLRNRQGYQ